MARRTALTESVEAARQTYYIKTDSYGCDVEATSFDDAAKQADEGFESAAHMIKDYEEMGGYCYIRNEETYESVGRIIQ